jgi:hypothetical protein
MALLSGGLLLNAQSVTFLGTAPQGVSQPPVPSTNITGLGLDGAGNTFYLDASGNLTRVTPSGTQATLATGLTNAALAVDYRGYAYIAETSQNRILSLAPGASTPAERVAVSNPTSLTADVHGDIFFLSNGALYEVIGNAGTAAS